MNTDDSEMEYVDDFGPIPPLFYSDLTKEPFQECTICQKKLLQNGTTYLIEKAFRVNKEFNIKETVFEYAICWDCAGAMKDTMSEESMKQMQNYFIRQSNMLERRMHLLQQSSVPVLNHWIGNCLFKGTPVSELSEYQVFGQFDGKNILYHETPYLISGEALHEMSELLSAQTKEEMDRFLDTYTGLPPELKKALLDGNLVFI